ncbi:MAG: decaprenyl-phosphate phosphoribosyltransferase [Candidatus Omnitrophica bacterium]|nr:decaprenyl-phosphate phosphoribosyltransferase [Candidatus Omnitrophota bacterium]
MISDLLFALRPKQWVKNLFVFIPLMFGKKLFAFPQTYYTFMVFVLFCMTASAVYLINDIFDLEEDRHHRIKKLRPLASGKITKNQAWTASAILLIGSIVSSYFINFQLAAVLAVYFFLNVLYTRFLKTIVIIDVLCIGLFFLLRILAGAITAEVVISHWLVFMIFLLAMFLGFHKRRQELRYMTADTADYRHRFVLKKYSVYFIDQMITVLTSSIVVAYMLYTVDVRTVAVFGTNHLFYTIPFIYYGIFRYLYIVHKKSGGEDPTVVFLSDPLMIINLGLWALTSICVIYFKF